MSQSTEPQRRPIATSAAAGEPSTGELVSRLSNEVSQLLRDEFRLAQLEVSGKAKKAGVGSACSASRA